MYSSQRTKQRVIDETALSMRTRMGLRRPPRTTLPRGFYSRENSRIRRILGGGAGERRGGRVT